MNYEEKTIERKSVYKGGIIDVDVLTVMLPDGRQAKRDIVLHKGASVIIPLTENGELHLVKQFRKPIEQVSLEIPAGKLDDNEEPEVCAKRELKEETGLIAGNIKHVLSMYSTPGFSNEVLHMFIATELEKGEACADEDEFITCEKIKVDRLVSMIFNGEIKDAKTIIGILVAEKYLKGEIKI